MTGQKNKTLLLGAKEALEEADSVLAQAEQMAFDVSAYRSRMLDARAYLIQALPVQHSLNISQIEEFTRQAHSIANEIRAEAHSLQAAIRIRWLGLALVWVFLLLMMVVLYLYRREREHTRREERS
jgi:hypothetical protein